MSDFGGRWRELRLDYGAFGRYELGGDRLTVPTLSDSTASKVKPHHGKVPSRRTHVHGDPVGFESGQLGTIGTRP